MTQCLFSVQINKVNSYDKYPFHINIFDYINYD